MPRIYIAGPMTCIPNYNRPAFNAAANYLTTLGWQPINPADNTPTHDGPCPTGTVTDTHDGHAHACYLRADLAALLTCDAICLLPGWEHSTGAQLEHRIAEVIGIRRIPWNAVTYAPGYQAVTRG